MSQFQEGTWTRECQACGHVQTAVPPAHGTLTDSYAQAKCRKCKSEALDYGKEWHEEDTDYTAE